ncbi:ornithine carbamoyltransferase, partial [Candidatus Aminicenantes bacterium AC-708-I09]|nr:ornithine carbamoyltransferase [Candidatus Aminicenantes bacterium AC-708-I09]
FEIGMLQLGGEAIYLSPNDIQMGKREPVKDIARNLERWVDGIMIRTFGHEIVLELAEYANIPVINGLSDLLHPCQAMADFMTLKEKKGKLKGLKLAYLGDGNNVAHSLIFAASKCGVNISIATPPGYEPKKEIIEKARENAKDFGNLIEITNDPESAVKDADAVYTDVWASMGQEQEREKRLKIFPPYQVNRKLMSLAKEDAVFMHCLPAHRGEEVTDDVIESHQSVVFDQAENRLHVQKAIMILLMGRE